MTWTDDMFEWAGREPNRHLVSRYTFDCSVAAVQDKQNRVPILAGVEGRDFAVCGEGRLTLWRDQLWMNVVMVFSDRFTRDGPTGDTEVWYFQLETYGTMTVNTRWWPRSIEIDDLTYTDRGGQFLTGFLDSPTGVWHIAISIDRQTADPSYSLR